MNLFQKEHGVNPPRRSRQDWLFGLRFFIPFVSQNIKDKHKIRPADAGRFCLLAFSATQHRLTTLFSLLVLFNDSHSFAQSCLLCPQNFIKDLIPLFHFGQVPFFVLATQKN
jgi:hypothetical protein